MEKEKITRILTSVIGLPFITALLIFANTTVMDIFTAIIALISMYEYFHCFKSTNKANPSEFLGYILCILIAFTHMVKGEILIQIIVLLIPTCILILFVEFILSNGKKTVKDISITMLGICYIPLMLIYLSFISNMNLGTGLTGRILIWFVLIASWGSDVFAYTIGRHFGKHKLTKISPKKTVEGSIAGVIGATVLGIIYAVLCNNLWGTEINYLLIGVIVAVLSVVGQIGDLAASSIKRYCEIKDFSDLLPGHGGNAR